MTGGGGALAEADFTSAQKGAESFLSALESKDPEKIAEASANHAKIEASKDHLPFFMAVAEKTATPSDIETVAKGFAGMKVTGRNTAKSSGLAGIIVGKQEENKTITRTIYVRKEKEGWKVQDFSGEKTLKRPAGLGGGTPGKRR